MDKSLDIKISLTTGVYKYDHVFKGNIYIYIYMFMYRNMLLFTYLDIFVLYMYAHIYVN
jgi:hypothetical protein